MGLLDDSSSRRSSDIRKEEPIFCKEIDNKRNVQKRTEIGGQRKIEEQDNIRRNKELDYLTREVLDDGLKRYFNRENFDKIITGLSTLYNNSGRNIFIILEQKPDAKLVMGSVKWNYYGYTINPDAHPIKIFVPMMDKNLFRNVPKKEIRFYQDVAYDFSDVREKENKNKKDEYTYVDFAIGRSTGKTPAETPSTIANIMCNRLAGADIDLNKKDWVFNPNSMLLQNNPELIGPNVIFNKKTTRAQKIEMNFDEINKIINSTNEYQKEVLAHNLLLASSELLYTTLPNIYNLGIKEEDSTIRLATLTAEKYFGLNNEKIPTELLDEIPFDIKNKDYKLMYLDNINRISNVLIQTIEDFCIKNNKIKGMKNS